MDAMIRIVGPDTILIRLLWNLIPRIHDLEVEPIAFHPDPFILLALPHDYILTIGINSLEWNLPSFETRLFHNGIECRLFDYMSGSVIWYGDHMADQLSTHINDLINDIYHYLLEGF